ncbi:MAG: ExeA family protein [Halioglobus sp.]
MYYQYFGLNEEPFSIAVNPRYLFMSARHRDALAHLLYGVGSGGGFILLTGEVGTGKTTINRCLLEQLPDDTDIAIILNPALNSLELLASACDEFGIEYAGDDPTLKSLTDTLHRFLLDNHARGRKTVLLIDEAQHLDFDVLEQIRLLTNLETNSQKLLQIILIGQPELAQMLARPELRQLNQRITARYNLEPLNSEETRAYIQHRLQVAGMSPDRELIPANVVRGVHRATRGIPRLINLLCDRMLLGAYGRNKSRVDNEMLSLAIREVMGEEPAVGTGWNWLLAVIGGLFLVLALVFVGAWFLLDDAPQPWMAAAPTATGTTAAIEGASVRQHTPPAVTASATSEASNATAADTQRNASGAPAVERSASVQLETGEGASLLWSLHSDREPPAEGCPTTVSSGLLCVRGEAGTWDELAVLDRPLVLQLVTAQRFSAELLLLGIEGQQGWAWSEAGVQRIRLADFAPLWTGEYHYLWHVPAGFSGPLALGDEGAAVAVVARAFASLDGQPEPLAGTQFNAALQQRVRLFQRRHGLIDDGVVGLQTLLTLNEQLGIDPSAAQARSQLQARLEAVSE